MTLAVLPHTRNVTNLRILRPGDPVNVEAAAMIKLALEQQKARRLESELTLGYLVGNGY